ncbi:thaumatin-like protein 1 [Beta vulgaris subsp. vulgaris]|uniref:thaumatin-like protein 1 n=1 Tax=Beta vulgaris subsp. vulgaris TaxID=3555 RepID=UPI00203727B2|nr:thaumatin-like protein 1 [Beta vulgaris subsp. vulgaris]
MNFSKLYTKILLKLVLLMLCSVYVLGTTFTFVNRCDYTVWPGLLAGASSPKLDSTGFELQHGGTRTFQAPAGWSGRFWGRSGCTFDSTGQGSCSTGDCGSGTIECNGSGATPPATLAEFTLNGSGGQDFYDVSLVDGYNLPMIVESTGGSGGCQSTGCVVDLNLRCPNELKAEGGGACRSACEAFGSPEYCCSGQFATPDTCKPSMYSQTFKNACPRAYSYAYDDASSTFTCSGGDYTITFCPSSPSQKSSTDTSTSNIGGTTGSGSGTGTSTSTGSSDTGSGSGSGSLMSDGSWIAKLASGDSSNTRHPSFGLQLALLFIVITSLATSFNL